MGFYDHHIAPRIVNLACGLKDAERQRLKVVPRAKGRVLEVGMGSGHNLPFYDPDQVEMVWGLEPGETMRNMARPKAERVPFDVEFLDLPGEEIPLDDDSADTVLTTFTLCTIPDAVAALAQMRRVLKPGGELIFLEHGEAPDERVRRWQHRIEPVWKPMAGGCHVTRRIPEMLEDAGFQINDIESGYLPGFAAKLLVFAAYEHWGSAKIA